MEGSVILKLSTGKEITLTLPEYEELKGMTTPVLPYIPWTPAPVSPYPWNAPIIYCNGTGTTPGDSVVLGGPNGICR